MVVEGRAVVGRGAVVGAGTTRGAVDVVGAAVGRGTAGGGPAVIGAYGRTGAGGRGGRVVDPLRVGGGTDAVGWATGGEDARPEVAGPPAARGTVGVGAGGEGAVVGTLWTVGAAAGATGGSGADRRGIRSGEGELPAGRAAGCGAGVGGASTQARDRRGTGTVAASSSSSFSSSSSVRSGSTSAREGRRGGAMGPFGLDADPGCGPGSGSIGGRPPSRGTTGCSWVTSAASFGSSGSAAGSARRGRSGGSSTSDLGSGRGAGIGSGACGTGAGTNPLDRRGTYATAWSASPDSVSNARRGRVTRSVFQARSDGAQGCDAFHPERTRSDPAKWFPGGHRWPTVDLSAPSTTHERISLPCRPCTAPATTV